MGLREFFRLPPPDEKVSQWHVAPVVDTCAYGFSWIWVLIPLLIFAGSDPKPKGGELDVAYVALYVLILAAVDVHRHYTIPLIYLDKQIRKQFPARFLFFPVVLLGVWSVSPLIATTRGVYLSIATVTAIMACALVVIQIIRRDGSVVSVGRRESIGLLIPFGVAGLITRDMVKPGAVVVDVGINRVLGANGKRRTVGDVAFDEVAEVAGHLSPVPGGVGPMTVAMLLRNTVEAAGV